jgi:hypothetical protein
MERSFQTTIHGRKLEIHPGTEVEMKGHVDQW